MNKTKIEWCSMSWNPVTGCKHGCPYCYARKIAERFRGSKAWPFGFVPTFHSNRKGDPQKMKKPQTIFVCSMADLFGEWVPDEWITSVFDACLKAPWHTYIFLTKNPKRYLTIPGEYLGKKNHWFGTTITSKDDAGERLWDLSCLPEGNTLISFEPLLGSIGAVLPLHLTGIKQVIIGAQTNPTIIPDQFWIAEIEQEADRAGAKVFCKDSLASIPDTMFRRELCWQVRK